MLRQVAASSATAAGARALPSLLNLQTAFAPQQQSWMICAPLLLGCTGQHLPLARVLRWSLRSVAMSADSRECRSSLLRFLSVTKVRIIAMTDLLLEHPTRRALPSGSGKGPGGALLPLSSGPKRCPVIGCGEPIDPSRLMCRRDWYLVPYALRGRIWATWRSGEAAFSSKHQAAVHEAIAFAQAVR